MTLLQIVVLAVVQGLTEFLPVSSSGHLVMVPYVTGWPDQGLDMDVAVHVGTLGAVLVYFHRDVFGMLGGVGRTLKGTPNPAAKLFLQIILATLPVVAAGFMLKEAVGTAALRSMEFIGWTMLGFGIVLWIADKACMTLKRVEHMPYGEALLIGLAQVLALLPGTSRSGITMTMARALGYERPDAARFSLLLSIPAIIAAGFLSGYDLYLKGDTAVTEAALLASGLAFITALIAVAVMMAWLKRASFTPFVLYRVVLGLALLVMANS